MATNETTPPEGGEYLGTPTYQLQKQANALYKEIRRRESEDWANENQPFVGKFYRTQTAYALDRTPWFKYFHCTGLDVADKVFTGFEFYVDEFGAVSVNPCARVKDLGLWEEVDEGLFGKEYVQLCQKLYCMSPNPADVDFMREDENEIAEDPT